MNDGVLQKYLTSISRPETNEELQDVESIFDDGTATFSYFDNGFFIFGEKEEYKRAVRPLLSEDRVLAVEQKVRTSLPMLYYFHKCATNASPRSSSATGRLRRR